MVRGSADRCGKWLSSRRTEESKFSRDVPLQTKRFGWVSLRTKQGGTTGFLVLSDEEPLNCFKEKKEMMEKTYNPQSIESKIYDRWLEKKYFHAEVDRSK